MQGVILFLFTLFCSAIVLFFDGVFAHGIFKQFESRHYAPVAGQVTQSEVKFYRESKGGRGYKALINYRYQVGGQTFNGARLRYTSEPSGLVFANGMVAAHPNGATVDVFYNPNNPGDALLMPGIKGSDFMMVLFLTPFHAIMFGFWVWLGDWLRERIFRPLAGGVKIISDGTVTRVRLPRFVAAGSGLATTGALGFVSVFALGLSTNMQPSLGLVFAVIAAIYLAGAGVYLWARRKISLGVDDLIINTARRTLDLPQTHGRKRRVTADVADIESLTVEKIAHTSSKGGVSYTYAPTVRLRGTEAGDQKLADWSDQVKAADFTDWLRKQLGL